MEDRPNDDETSVLCCAECSTSLAHDQRYCVECGARRGPLPQQVAGTVAAILEQGGRANPRRGPAAATEPVLPPEPAVSADWIPSPRAAAVAILSVLGFGVVAGSLVGGASIASLAGAPLLLIARGSNRPASPAENSGGGGGGSGGTTRTITTIISSSAPAQQAQTSTPSTTGSGGSGGTTTTPPASSGILGLPPIKHVFLIVLSDQGYSQTFGSTNLYFAKTLRKQGKLLENYYAVTAGELANEIALISGQGPTPQSANECPQFADITPAGKGAMGQVLGTGCVYPSRTETLANQLSSSKYAGWRAYVEGINDGRAGDPKSCRHPALGANDADQAPRAKDPYVTWRNPFVYFHSVIDTRACQRDDVALTAMAKDLKSASTTPSLSYIVPSPCDDGNGLPCQPGARSGLAAADKFLHTVVPKIEHSAAYKADGLIAITFNQAPQIGPYADAQSCCDAQTFPNLPTPTPTTGTSTTPTTGTSTTTPTSTTTTPSSVSGGQTNPTGGGGQVGLLLISPYVKPGSVDVTDYYNHFSLLATIEDLFGLKLLGYASDPALPVFDAAIFNGHPK